jgi:hypothetical protein
VLRMALHDAIELYPAGRALALPGLLLRLAR